MSGARHHRSMLGGFRQLRYQKNRVFVLHVPLWFVKGTNRWFVHIAKKCTTRRVAIFRGKSAKVVSKHQQSCVKVVYVAVVKYLKMILTLVLFVWGLYLRLVVSSPQQKNLKVEECARFAKKKFQESLLGFWSVCLFLLMSLFIRIIDLYQI